LREHGLPPPASHRNTLHGRNDALEIHRSPKHRPRFLPRQQPRLHLRANGAPALPSSKRRVGKDPPSMTMGRPHRRPRSSQPNTSKTSAPTSQTDANRIASTCEFPKRLPAQFRSTSRSRSSTAFQNTAPSLQTRANRLASAPSSKRRVGHHRGRPQGRPRRSRLNTSKTAPRLARLTPTGLPPPASDRNAQPPPPGRS
jgi:hypothetical protein